MIAHAVPLWRPLDELRYSTKVPLNPGDLVKVPLAGKTVYACVVKTETGCEEGLKELEKRVAESLFHPSILELARNIAVDHMAFWGEMLGAVLPKDILLPPKTPGAHEGRSAFANLKMRGDEEKIISEIERAKKRVLLQSSSDYTGLFVSLIRKYISNQKQVLVLLPDEPSLARYCERFSAFLPVSIYSSNLGQAERRSLWHGVNQGSVDLVFGLRSSVLLPFRNLGLVIVIDADSNYYKERTRHLDYDAVDIAARRIKEEGTKLILFSVAPTLEMSHMARSGHFFRIERQVPQKGKAIIVEMKNEKEGAVLSSTLSELIVAAHKRKMQSLLLLNRLGTAGRLMCLECGHVLSCITCGLSLKLVKIGEDLECPVCSRKYLAPERCPQCGAARWQPLSPGLLTLKKELGRLIPNAKTCEITAERKPLLDEVYNSDVIFGTSAALEYIPSRVHTAALLSWDAEQSRPDFRSSERAYRDVAYMRRLISSSPDARLVVQTYRPRDNVLRWALTGDYESFFHYEIRKRRELGYPPYRRLVLFERTSLKNAWDAEKLSQSLVRDGVEILGPYTGRKAKETLLVKIRRDLSPGTLLDARTLLKSGWQSEVDPVEIM
ncbi:hypothetical protein GX441_08800 [bacterium]|nr:hypothetical protein [bacterium]